MLKNNPTIWAHFNSKNHQISFNLDTERHNLNFIVQLYAQTVGLPQAIWPKGLEANQSGEGWNPWLGRLSHQKALLPAAKEASKTSWGGKNL